MIELRRQHRRLVHANRSDEVKRHNGTYRSHMKVSVVIA